MSKGGFLWAATNVLSLSGLENSSSNASLTMTTEVELAYTAGLLDGEGCVCARHLDRIIRGRRYETFAMTVQVRLTVSKPLYFLQEKFGGSVNQMRQDTRQPHYKKAWSWILCSNKAKWFLLQVLPYLQIKQLEAMIAIVLQDNINRAPTERVLEIRRYLAAECKAEKRFNA